VVSPPSRTVSPEASERVPVVGPAVEFAVPAPPRLAPGTRTHVGRRGRHEAPSRHLFLRNQGRAVPETRRFGLPAGQVLVAMVLCLGVWTLLSAHALHQASEASPVGKRRSASLTVLGPIDALSHALFIDRLAGVAQRAVGHDPNEVAPGGGGILADGPPPPKPPPPSPVQPRVTNPNGTAGHGHGQGSGHGQGNGGNPHPKGNGNGPGSGSGQKTVPLRVPTAANPLRVLVVGDSFAQDVEIGLAPVTDSRYVRIIQKGLHSTGLSRPDYYNWPGALQSFVAQYHPDLVIVMLGGNDPQALRTNGGGVVPWGDPRWLKIYRQRVDQMLDIATESRAHVAWIGMPIMGIPGYNEHIHALDRIYQSETARRSDVLYLDTWAMFDNQDGKYTDYLPDHNGNLHLMRASDKIHFSSSGNQRMTGALIRLMKHRWELSQKALG
jgi:lysophospholipase L1-like esterase